MIIRKLCLFRREPHRVVGVGGPVSIVRIDWRSGAGIHATGLLFHRDAILNRTDADTEIASDTLVIHHLEMPDAIFFCHDRLMRGVLTDNVAART